LFFSRFYIGIRVAVAKYYGCGKEIGSAVDGFGKPLWYSPLLHRDDPPISNFRRFGSKLDLGKNIPLKFQD
jgi:hypothetical protein